jgi:hypothetical protein
MRGQTPWGDEFADPIIVADIEAKTKQTLATLDARMRAI